MLINQDFTQDRSKYLGGSDLGAILGLSPYKTPLDVWLEKTGKHSEQKDSLPLRFGSFAESFVASEYARATANLLTEYPLAICHPQHPYLQGHIDRFVTANSNSPLFNGDGSCTASHILECKTANPFTQSQWGDAGSDEVPMSYLAQCHWYLSLTQLERCDLAVLFGNSDFRIYHIERDTELESTLLESAVDFWQNHVLCKQAPKPATEADIRSLYSQETPEMEISADESFLETLFCYEETNAQANAITTKCEALKHEILIRMADAEKITHNGKVIATWKSSKGARRLDTKALSQAHPELADKFSFQAPGSRRFVFKGLS
jgi:putative phage-type endonuclease